MSRRKEAPVPRQFDLDDLPFLDARKPSPPRTRDGIGRCGRKPIPAVPRIHEDNNEEDEGATQRRVRQSKPYWPEGVHIKDMRVWNSMVKRTRGETEERARCIGENMAMTVLGRRPRESPLSESEICEEKLRRKGIQIEVKMVFETALMELGDESVKIELGPDVPSPSRDEEWMPLPPPCGQVEVDNLSLLRHVSIIGRTYRSRRELNECSKRKSIAMSPAEEVRYWLSLLNSNTPPLPSTHAELVAIKQEARNMKAGLDNYLTAIETRRSLWIQETAEDPSEELRRMDLVTKFEEMKTNILKEKPLLIEEARRGLEERRRVLSIETMEERVTRISRIYEEMEVQNSKRNKSVEAGKKKKRIEKQTASGQGTDDETPPAICVDEEEELRAKALKKKAAASAYNIKTHKMEVEEYKLFLTLLPLFGVGLAPDEKHGPHIHPKQPLRFKGLRFPAPSSAPDALSTEAEQFEVWLKEERSMASIEYWSQRKPHLRTPEGVWAYRRLLAQCIKRRKQDNSGPATEESLNAVEDVKKLKDLIVKDGHEILRHFTLKRFYLADTSKAIISTKAFNLKYYEDMKDYQRRRYNQKRHGITLGPGEYLKDRVPTASVGRRTTMNTIDGSTVRRRRQPYKTTTLGGISVSSANPKSLTTEMTKVTAKQQNRKGKSTPTVGVEESEDDPSDDGDSDSDHSTDSVEVETGSLSACDDGEHEAMAVLDSDSASVGSVEGTGAAMPVERGTVDYDMDSLLAPMPLPPHAEPQVVHDHDPQTHPWPGHDMGHPRHITICQSDHQLQPLTPVQSSYTANAPSSAPASHTEVQTSQGITSGYHFRYHNQYPHSEDTFPRYPVAAACSSTAVPHNHMPHQNYPIPFPVSHHSFLGAVAVASCNNDNSSSDLPKGSSHTTANALDVDSSSSSSDSFSSASEYSEDDNDDDDSEPQRQQSTSNPKRGRLKGSKNTHPRTTRLTDSATNPSVPRLRQSHSRDIWNNKKRRKYHQHDQITPPIVDDDDRSNSTNSKHPTNPRSTTILPISSLVSRVHENATVCLICGHEEKDPTMLEKHLSASHPVRRSQDDGERGNNCTAAPAASTSEIESQTQETLTVIEEVEVAATDDDANVEKGTKESAALSSDDEKAETQKQKLTPCKCQLCGTSVDTSSKLILHLLRDHLSKSTCYKCPFRHCAYNPSSLKALKRHLSRRHQSSGSKNPYILGLHISKRVWNRAKEFHCTYCALSFENPEDAKQHCKDVHESRRYYCPRCGLLFKVESQLTLHMKLFHSDNTCKTSLFTFNLQESESSKMCKICRCEFSSKCFLCAHLKAGHNVSEVVTTPDDFAGVGSQLRGLLAVKSNCEHGCRKSHEYLCCFCGEDFNSRKSLQGHIDSSIGHISDEDASSLESTLIFPALSDPFKCELCPSSFSDFYMLLGHSLVLHGLGPFVLNKQNGTEKDDDNMEFEHNVPVEEAETDVLIAAAAAARSEPNVLPPLPCGECEAEDSGLDSSTFHEGHLRYNVLLVKTCEPCDRIFSRCDVLPKHLEAHHGIPRQDQVPPPKLSGRNTISRAEGGSGNQFVQCCNPKCRLFFSQDEFHKIHTLLKKDPDVRKCPECNWTFPTPPKLLKHRHVMHGLKLDPKMITNQKYDPREKQLKIDASNVDSCFAHYTIEGISVYSCKLCSNRHFKTKDFVVKHILGSHEGSQRKFYCDQCNFSHTERAKVRTHQKVQHSNDVTLYLCPFCSMSSRREDSVTKHTEKVHGDMERAIFTKSMIQIVKTTLTELRKEKKEKEGMEELCAICNRFLGSKKALQAHLAKHGIVRKDSTWCDVCGQQISMRAMPKHLKVMHSGVAPTKASTLPVSQSFPMIKVIEVVQKIYQEMEKECVPFDNWIKTQLKLVPAAQRNRRRKEQTSSYSSASSGGDDDEDVEMETDSSEDDDPSVEICEKRVKRRRRDPPARKGVENEENVPLRRSKRNVNPVKRYSDMLDLEIDDDDATDLPLIPIKTETESTMDVEEGDVDVSFKIEPEVPETNGDKDFDFEDNDNLIPSEHVHVELQTVAEEAVPGRRYDLKTLVIPLERCDALVDQLKKKKKIRQSQEEVKKTDKVRNRYLKLVTGTLGNLFAQYGGFTYKRLGGRRRAEETDPFEPDYFLCVVPVCKAALILHEGSGVVERAGVHENHQTVDRPPSVPLAAENVKARSMITSNLNLATTPQPNPVLSTAPLHPPPDDDYDDVLPLPTTTHTEAESTTSPPPLTASEMFMKLRRGGKSLWHAKKQNQVVVVTKPPHKKTPEVMVVEENKWVALDHTYSRGSMGKSRKYLP